MTKTTLTKKLVATLKPPSSGETWTMDADLPGFGVRIRATGRATYMARWTDARGKQHKLALGDTRHLSVDAARALAAKQMALATLDRNPIAQRKEVRADRTVTELGEEVLAYLSDRGRSAVYLKDCRRLLDKCVTRHLGTRAVRELAAHEVDTLLRAMYRTPTAANHTRALLSRMFRLAIKWGYRSDNPVFGAERYELRARQRHYSNAELRALLGAMIATRSKVSRAAAGFIMLTGSRPQEAFVARWADIDLGAGIWTKPSQHVKQRRSHRVELSAEALTLLQAIKRDQDASRHAGTPFVFPSKYADRPIRSIATWWDKVRTAAGLADARIYDLRRTFITRLFAKGVPINVVMALSGHTTVAVLVKHYAQVPDGLQQEALKGLYGPVLLTAEPSVQAREAG